MKVKDIKCKNFLVYFDLVKILFPKIYKGMFIKYLTQMQEGGRAGLAIVQEKCLI
jgi:hypothetical protein